MMGGKFLVLVVLAIVLDLSEVSGACDRDRFGYLCNFQDKCGATIFNGEDGYIINGEAVEEDEMPFYAQVVMPNAESCGGVLVSDYHVITAAHCLKRVEDLERDVVVILGTNEVLKPDLKQFPFDSMPSNHYQVDAECHRLIEAHKGDIVVLRLKQKVQFTRKIQPACWRTGEHKVLIRQGSFCYQLGHGFKLQGDVGMFSDKVEKLRVTHTNIFKIETANLPTNKWKLRFFIGWNPKGRACGGDSGGPTLCRDSRNRWTLVGVQSAADTKCPENFPFVISLVDEELAATMMGNCAPPDYTEEPSR